MQHLLWLQWPIGRLPIYKLLQYGSGLFGLVGLWCWAWQWWLQATVARSIESLPMRSKAIVWCGIGLMAVLVMGVAIGLHRSPLDTTSTIVVRAIIGAISGWFVGLGLYAIGVKIFT